MSIQVDDSTDAFLEHYGVKGMKWGVRRQQLRDKLRGNRPPGLREVSEDAAKVKSIKSKRNTKGMDSLSNAELKTALERLDLEARMNRLSPSAVSTGRERVGKLVDRFGQQSSNKIIDSAAAAVAGAVIAAALARKAAG